MLMKIKPNDVELGMFVQKFEGNWFSHPFWKAKFLLTEGEDLAAIRASAVRAVVIDTSRGEKPGGQKAASQAMARHTATSLKAAAGVQPRRPVQQAPRASVSRELGKARAKVQRAEKNVTRIFLQARLGKCVSLGDVEPMITEIYDSVQRNQFAFNGLVRCREMTEETFRHGLACCALMVSLARELRLSPGDTRDAGMAGLLMDVGVGRLPVDLAPVEHDHRALKPDLFYQHVLFGEDFLATAGDIPETVRRVCRNHHERMDGTGQPHGLREKDLDILTRMAMVCDDFDYLVNGGLNRPAVNPAQALRMINEQGEKYDPKILAAFIQAIGIYPIGSFLKLRSGKLAMVVDIGRDNPAQPIVRTFYSLPDNTPVTGETIDLANCWGQDALDAIADLDGLDLPPEAELRAQIMESALSG